MMPRKHPQQLHYSSRDVQTGIIVYIIYLRNAAFSVRYYARCGRISAVREAREMKQHAIGNEAALRVWRWQGWQKEVYVRIPLPYKHMVWSVACGAPHRAPCVCVVCVVLGLGNAFVGRL
jgi:hypothetical protein